jgi:hypothetical protein
MLYSKQNVPYVWKNSVLFTKLVDFLAHIVFIWSASNFGSFKNHHVPYVGVMLYYTDCINIAASFLNILI